MSRKQCLYCAAALVAFFLPHAAVAQYPQPNANLAGAQPGTPLPPQQLDDLVVLIALYPDPLLAEVLAVSTYPMEIAEAKQWVRERRLPSLSSSNTARTVYYRLYVEVTL